MAKQSQVKHQRLMKKAEELFMKYGYKAISMDQIALEAGISKMTIYKHFHSKEELFIAVLLDMTAYHIEKLEAEMDTRPHTLDKIETLYSYSMRNVSDFSDVLINDTMERPQVVQAITEYKQKWILTMWRGVLENGMALGEIRPLDLDFTATLLMNMPMAFIRTDYFTNPDKLTVFLENFYDFVKYGLLGVKSPTV